MSNIIPQVFIGSSSESIPFARAVETNLRKMNIDATAWDKNILTLGGSTLEGLLEQFDQCDYAIYVFGLDDRLIQRGDEFATARDNVLFEFGLATGKLGKDRVFFVVPRGIADYRLPSDLDGITHGLYEPILNGSNEGYCESTKQFSDDAGRLIIKGGKKGAFEKRAGEILEEIRDLIGRHLDTHSAGLFPEFYATNICECIASAKREILVACDFPNYGVFSDQIGYDKYWEILQEQKLHGVNIQYIVLSREERRRLNWSQFARDESEWIKRKQDERISAKLEKFMKRTAEQIETLEEFRRVLSRFQDSAMSKLNQLCDGRVNELNFMMPVYLWVADDKRAVFSIPTFEQEASEHGFETRDPSLTTGHFSRLTTT